jgi:large subunit ribosomal protein L5
MADKKPEKKSEKKKAAAAAPQPVEAKADQVQEPPPPPRMKDRYFAEIRPALMKRYGYENVHQAPRLLKVVLNMGVGDAIQDARRLEEATQHLALISGQKPAVRRARKSIASFKLREGMAIGVTVNLRRARMYEFVDRLVTVVMPRIRDFRGVSGKSFDGRGNYTLGVKEQIVFPEINYDKVEKVRGLDITFVTSARNDEEARGLLEALGVPFRTS